MGRSRWHRSLDLQWKDDALRVTRERFVAYDTVDAELDRDCTVDLTAAEAEVVLWKWSHERPPCG